ncbi:MAG: hypothetical protein WBI17_04630 [Clostridiaceae bacterium]
MKKSFNSSIFSGKYQKKLRRQKFFKGLGFTVLILAILFLVFRNPILGKIEKVKSDIAEENQQKEELLNNLPETPAKEVLETPTAVETPVEEETALTMVLPNGKTLELLTVDENGESIFTPLELSEAFEGDLSPSKKLVTILDKETQELYLMDNKGTVTDITYKIYKNNKGYTESKESIMTRVPGFVWGTNPKFLDEDTVVYLSQLPWFDERRFLYIVELNPLSHRNMQSVKGVEINLKTLTEKGLEYESDGKTFFLTPDYKIVN